jgi:hypothetical protein
VDSPEPVAVPPVRRVGIRPVVSVHVWGVRPRRVPAALGRMATDRVRLRSLPGLRFAKLMGTGDGRTFTTRDADPLHWALVAVWDDDAAADGFGSSVTSRRWDALANERLDVRMAPLSSRGRWAGREPFGESISGPVEGPVRDSASGSANGPVQGSVHGLVPGLVRTGRDGAEPLPGEGPVAAITRARLRVTRARAFWRAVPPVSADLGNVEGLRLAIGIGEAPIGLQGTFSLWSTAAALTAFAYRREAHLDVVRRTPAERWYAEELFARFAVRSVTGTFNGTHP